MVSHGPILSTAALTSAAVNDSSTLYPTPFDAPLTAFPSTLSSSKDNDIASLSDPSSIAWPLADPSFDAAVVKALAEADLPSDILNLILPSPASSSQATPALTDLTCIGLGGSSSSSASPLLAPTAAHKALVAASSSMGVPTPLWMDQDDAEFLATLAALSPSISTVVPAAAAATATPVTATLSAASPLPSSLLDLVSPELVDAFMASTASMTPFVPSIPDFDIPFHFKIANNNNSNYNNNAWIDGEADLFGSVGDFVLIDEPVVDPARATAAAALSPLAVPIASAPAPATAEPTITIPLVDLAALLAMARNDSAGSSHSSALSPAMTSLPFATAKPSRVPTSTAVKQSRGSAAHRMPSSSVAASSSPYLPNVDADASNKPAKKMHKCSFPGCESTFSRAFNLKTHEMIHVSDRERPFECPEADCGKTFVRIHDLNRHSLIHNPVRGFVCDKCGKGFARSDALFRHVTKSVRCGGAAANVSR